MFESKGAKEMKNKRNRLSQMASSKKIIGNSQYTGVEDKTVYGELKLSDKLSTELSQIRNEVSNI